MRSIHNVRYTLEHKVIPGWLYNEKETLVYALLSRDEYIDIVVKQLELLRPEIIIQRLTGDPIKNNLIAPDWVLNKTTILNDIDKEMKKRNTYQGVNL